MVKHSLFKVAVSILVTPNFSGKLAEAVMVSQLSQALFSMVKCPLLVDVLKALTSGCALYA